MQSHKHIIHLHIYSHHAQLDQTLISNVRPSRSLLYVTLPPAAILEKLSCLSNSLEGGRHVSSGMCCPRRDLPSITGIIFLNICERTSTCPTWEGGGRWGGGGGGRGSRFRRVLQGFTCLQLMRSCVGPLLQGSGCSGSLTTESSCNTYTTVHRLTSDAVSGVLWQ